MHVTTIKQQVLCCLHGAVNTGKSHHKSIIPGLVCTDYYVQVLVKTQKYGKYSQLLL